jgi:hypothetical protein
MGQKWGGTDLHIEPSAEPSAARRFPPFPVDNAPCCVILWSKEIEVDLKS